MGAASTQACHDDSSSPSNLYGLVHDNIHPRQVSHKPHIKRVLCVSDIHTDYKDNLNWAQNVQPDGDALLIVAGDVSHDETVIRETLKILQSKFGAVTYTPGNHDLWIDADREGAGGLKYGITDSVQKLTNLLLLCDDIGIETGPMRIGSNDKGLWVVPLLSWHHQSFDTEPDIDPDAWGRIPSVERLVADYRRARWPSPLSPRDDSVARFVDGINDYILGDPSLFGKDDAPVMTFSHFLPRIELTPEKRYLTFPTLSKAVGSDYVERRLRLLGSSLHVFGHTHFGWDMELDGVRYVQASLAYPKEWQFRAGSLSVGTMSEEHDFQPVCVWDEDDTKEGADGSGFPAVLGGYWSDRYYHVDRNPDITDALPPWNANRFKKLSGRVEQYVRHNSTRFSKF